MQKRERLVKLPGHGCGSGNALGGIFRKIRAANNQSISRFFHTTS
jgi:hypothetical protein